MAPKDRTKQKSAPVVSQLLVRAAQRLRDDGFFRRRLALEVKWIGRDRETWTCTRSFSETQNTGVLLHVLQEIWPEVPDLKPYASVLPSRTWLPGRLISLTCSISRQTRGL